VKRTRVTSVIALIIFVLAVLGTPVAVMGHWGHRTVVDQSTYLDVVSPLATDPEIQEAVAAVMTDAIVARVDTASAVDSFLDRLLPDSQVGDVLLNPITAGINNLINQLVLQFLQSELFGEVWIEVNTGIQNSLVRILEGSDGGAVYIRNGQLVLDVSNLVIAIQERLVDRGYGIAANITIEPGQRTIVLADAPGLAQIQFIYGLLNPLLSWALAVLALAYGASIALARRRGRQTVFVGVALILWSLVLSAALNRGAAAFDNALSGTPLARASNSFWEALFANLMAGLTTMLVLGVIVVVIGFIAGRTKLAQGIRQQLRDSVSRTQAALPQHWQVPWIESHIGLSRGIAIAVPVAFFAFTDGFSLVTLIWTTILALALVFAVQVLGQPRQSVNA
jgi:hypothetical protein